MKHSLFTLFLSFLLFATGCSVENIDPRPDKTEHPFEAYLFQEDPAYRYELMNTVEAEDHTLYVVKMVSQEWLTADLVDMTEWWHWLTIIVPHEIRHSTGFVWINGGSHTSSAPQSANPLVLQTALATGTVTADLRNIPFQPIRFLDDRRLDRRTEDALIAYGWRKFLEGGARDEDAVWLARLPMTKAVIRAMDTVTEFIENKENLPVETFVVAGGSKRGWTTYTTGIFDERVIAMAPIVIDLLQLIPSFEHHWQAYGEWSPAIRDYVEEGIMQWQHSAEYQRMLELVDPYSYIDRLDMPKYIINSAGDEFFLPDSWKFYWDELIGEKYLRYVPNTGHGLNDSDALISLISFYQAILNDQKLPEFNWTAKASGFQIQMDPAHLPDQLFLWSAHNSEGRDFRIYVAGEIWEKISLEIPDNGQIFVPLDNPLNGYRAWFVEAVYDAETPLPFKQTTGVVVTPDTYPFGPFVNENPLGTSGRY